MLGLLAKKERVVVLLQRGSEELSKKGGCSAKAGRELELQKLSSTERCMVEK